MPKRLARKAKSVSHLPDPPGPREHRGAVLPEEAADAGGVIDRLSAVGGLLVLVMIVAALAWLMTGLAG